MFIQGKRIASIAMIGLIGLSGCSSSLWKSSNQMDQQKYTSFGQAAKDQRAAETGYYETAEASGHPGVFHLGGEGGILGGSGAKATKEEVRAKKLFAGAMAVVMELPIAVANQEGGVISTDWKADPSDPSLRYRLNIRISGREPYGEVAVAVLKQELIKGNWMDRNPDPQRALLIEKAIRKRAMDEHP